MAATGHVKWTGGLRDGSGTIDTGTGAVEGVKYSAGSRFEGKAGSNPEELLAAAHAACFSMALTLFLEMAGHSPQGVETTAAVTLKRDSEGFTITRIHLDTEAKVDGISDEDLEKAANGAKEGCPLSRALAAVPEITLDAKLAS